MAAFPIESGSRTRCSGEWLVLRILMRILLAVIHLFLESLCFLLIAERKAGEAFFEFESMEEDAVLVVREVLIELLVPYDPTARRRDIDKFNPKCVSYQIIRQHSSTL